LLLLAVLVVVHGVVEVVALVEFGLLYLAHLLVAAPLLNPY
jgi:hypothetical protein